jgi:hypothetical protein
LTEGDKDTTVKTITTKTQIFTPEAKRDPENECHQNIAIQYLKTGLKP